MGVCMQMAQELGLTGLVDWDEYTSLFWDREYETFDVERDDDLQQQAERLRKFWGLELAEEVDLVYMIWEPSFDVSTYFDGVNRPGFDQDRACVILRMAAELAIEMQHAAENYSYLDPEDFGFEDLPDTQLFRKRRRARCMKAQGTNTMRRFLSDRGCPAGHRSWKRQTKNREQWQAGAERKLKKLARPQVEMVDVAVFNWEPPTMIIMLDKRWISVFSHWELVELERVTPVQFQVNLERPEPLEWELERLERGVEAAWTQIDREWDSWRQEWIYYDLFLFPGMDQREAEAHEREWEELCNQEYYSGRYIDPSEPADTQWHEELQDQWQWWGDPRDDTMNVAYDPFWDDWDDDPLDYDLEEPWRIDDYYYEGDDYDRDPVYDSVDINCLCADCIRAWDQSDLEEESDRYESDEEESDDEDGWDEYDAEAEAEARGDYLEPFDFGLSSFPVARNDNWDGDHSDQPSERHWRGPQWARHKRGFNPRRHDRQKFAA